MASHVETALQIAEGLEGLAALLRSETFVRKAAALRRDPGARNAVAQDARAYFVDQGIATPEQVKLSFEPKSDAISGCFLWSVRGTLHGICFSIDENGVTVDTY